jgi:hypothetical protein
MKKTIGWGVLLMLLLSPLRLSADQALIIYASGEEIEIHDASGEVVEVSELIGHPLGRGDTLITGEDSFVEIRLDPGRNVIKIAENTTFQLQGIEARASSIFQVFYGSVRARVQKLAKAEEFGIRGGDAIAGVRGTDFGLNVLVDRDQEDADPVTEIFCFNGKILVTPTFELPEQPAADAADAEGVLLLNAGEMVRVSRTDPGAAYEPFPISEEIRSYWESNPFQGRKLSDKELAPESYRLERSRKQLTLAGSSLLAAGLLMEFTGVISLAAGRNSDISDSFRREALKNSGIALISGGSFFLTGSLVTFLRSAALQRRIDKAASDSER